MDEISESMLTNGEESEPTRAMAEVVVKAVVLKEKWWMNKKACFFRGGRAGRANALLPNSFSRILPTFPQN